MPPGNESAVLWWVVAAHRYPVYSVLSRATLFHYPSSPCQLGRTAKTIPSFPSRRFRVLTGILSTTVKQQSLILSAESKPKGFGTSCCKQAKAWHHLLSVLCLWRHILYPFTCLELLKWHTFWAGSSALLSLHCQKLIHLWWGNRTAGRMLWVSFSCLHLRIWAGPSLDSGLAWALLQQMCKEHFVHHPRLPLCDRYCRITKPGTSCDIVHEGMSWVS